MTLQVFSCPSCTAPIQYDGKSSMVACPYCDMNVIVPEILRPPREAARQGESVQVRAYQTTQQQSSSRSGCVWSMLILAVAGVLIAGGAGWFVYSMSAPVAQLATNSIEMISEVQEAQDAFVLPQFSTSVPATATPAHAALKFAFGSAGVGAGRFDDARGIALDQNGHVYVGEYSTGRIQVFDEEGAFIAQWNVPGSPYLDKFAVSRDGVLVALGGREWQQFEAQSGSALGALPVDGVANGNSSVVALADGGWLLMMDDDIVRVNRAGDEVLRIANAVASASGDSEMIPVLAADGLGTIYVLARMQQVVYKFGADGRYISRFGGRARGAEQTPGSLQAANSIAVDGAGRVYIGDIFGIKVFDSEGRYLHDIDTDGFPFGLAFRDSGDLYAVERDHVSVYAIHE